MFSERRSRRLAGNGKINHGKGMFGAAALTFPFQNIEIGENAIGIKMAQQLKSLMY